VPGTAAPAETFASGVRRSIRAPANEIEPWSGASTPAIRLNSVVLPAPFGPITAKISPSPTAKLTPSTAVSPRKRLVT